MLDDQRPTIIWLNAFLVALTFAAICSRVGRRVFVVGTFSWHDALIISAAVFSTIFSIFQIYCTQLGLGLPEHKVDQGNMVQLAKLVMASNCFYFLCNWAVKHALLLFYSEITRKRGHLISIYVMHFVAFGFGSSSILVNLFQCRPFNKAWKAEIPGYCVNLATFFYFNSSIMLLTDIVLYIMPVVFTWHLQLRRPQRIGLNALFALGGLVLVASAARVYSVHMFAVQPDFTWRFANAMIWSVIENHLAVVVACAPSMKVILLIVFPRLASSFTKIISAVTPSYSRSRSRASNPMMDLESGTTRKSDKLKPTPSNTPLPSPAFPSPKFSAESAESGSRQSKNFSKWFRGSTGPRDRVGSGDSLEGTGLVYIGEGEAATGSNQVDDIRVEHTISVQRD